MYGNFLFNFLQGYTDMPERKGSQKYHQVFWFLSIYIKTNNKCYNYEKRMVVLIYFLVSCYLSPFLLHATPGFFLVFWMIFSCGFSAQSPCCLIGSSRATSQRGFQPCAFWTSSSLLTFQHYSKSWILILDWPLPFTRGSLRGYPAISGHLCHYLSFSFHPKIIFPVIASR